MINFRLQIGNILGEICTKYIPKQRGKIYILLIYFYPFSFWRSCGMLRYLSCAAFLFGEVPKTSQASQTSIFYL